MSDNLQWTVPTVPTHVLRIRISTDGHTGFSAVCLNLPGAGSQGDTVAEAKRNAVEAVQGCLDAYHAGGQPVPWSSRSEADTVALAEGEVVVAMFCPVAEKWPQGWRVKGA